jgi:leader peptidase (prepilin peptidase) / N-methyltransferase
VSPLLIAAAVLAGFAAGWIQRPVIAALAVRAAGPCPPSCPRCGGQVPGGGRTGRAALHPAGRCPACRARIGPPWLATELTTGLALGVLTARLHPGPGLAAAAWLVICGGALGWIDGSVQRLPDVLTAPAYAGTLALLLAGAAACHWAGFGRAALGGVALAAFYLLLIVISPSGMGLGDAKLALSVGTLLAWSGWGVLLDGTMAAFALGGIYAVSLLTLGRASGKQRLAFGPCILLGALAALVI